MRIADRIVTDPAVLAGKPVVKGTRLAVEFIVGLLQIELLNGAAYDDFNAELRRAAAQARGIVNVPEIPNHALAEIRARLAELVHRWHTLPAGASLELPFGVGDAPCRSTPTRRA